MKIFKTLEFTKWQKKSDLTDELLKAAIQEMQAGLIDANLGGNIYKKRIAKYGSGKSSSYRTIVATKKQNVWIFIYGFAKNKQVNITKNELSTLQDFAHELLSLQMNCRHYKILPTNFYHYLLIYWKTPKKYEN